MGITKLNWFRGIWTFTALIVAFSMVLLALCWDTETHFKGLRPEEDRSVQQKVFNRCYFAANHITTGSGDIVPASLTARIVTFVFFYVLVLEITQLVTHGTN